MVDRKLEKAEKARKEGECSSSQILTTPTRHRKNGNHENLMVKSPSDTTIYAPALRQSGVKQMTVAHNLLSDGGMQNNGNITEMISNFVDAAREETHGDEGDSRTVVASKITVPPNDNNIPGYAEAKRRAEEAVLEAEKFKAQIEAPGMNIALATNNLGSNMESNSVIPNIGSGVSDDDFFHLTCHI